MRFLKRTLLVLTSAIASCMPARQAEESGASSEAIESLVEAERAFASLSVAQGMRAAFLENLSDDAIVFAPGPVNGKALWTDRPASLAVLSWEPSFADIAAAGDLGYTTGPWEIRPDRESEPTGWGHYASVWMRDSDGRWKVAIDAGITHERPIEPVRLAFASAAPASGREVPRDPDAARAALLERDREFSRVTVDRGLLDAFASFAAEDVRINFSGVYPLVGRDRIVDAFSAGWPDWFSWEPTGASVSASGDLGFTYGVAQVDRCADDEDWRSAAYLRIWKRQSDGEWRVVLDLLSPIPPASP